MKQWVETKELIRALKCSNDPDHTHKCIREKCPYFFTDTSNDIQQFIKEHNITDPDFANGCDYERLGFEAADRLEGLQKLLDAYNYAMKRITQEERRLDQY